MALTRRDFVKLPVAAATASAVVRPACAATKYSMPGLYPGRVVGVTHSGSSIDFQYQTVPIQNMVRRGMMALTGLSDYVAAWRKLFQPGDIVAIKVNPNGSSAIISSPACLLEIINGLLSAGVAPMNIIVCERYQALLSTVKGWLPSWVQTAWASPGGYLTDQTGISGYDPAYYVNLPQYLLPSQNVNNLAHTRSYAALFVTKQVTKIISLAVLKDHQAAGVTLNLKNMAIGCYNNCNRFHDNAILVPSENYLLNAIPALVAAPVIRNKVVLGIIDGVHGLFDGGPATYSDPQYGFVWEHKTMYFATDIVAADRIGWNAIDAKRGAKGMPPEEAAGNDGYDVFAVRQPHHITVAGQMGLGVCSNSLIDFQQFAIG